MKHFLHSGENGFDSVQPQIHEGGRVRGNESFLSDFFQPLKHFFGFGSFPSQPVGVSQARESRNAGRFGGA